MKMIDEWARGYGQHYSHLVKNKTTSPGGNFMLAVFVCGQSTDYLIDALSDCKFSNKCPKCRKLQKKANV